MSVSADRPPEGRVALFGDVGGHAAELRSALVRLGADPETLALPADLTVVQVGDLIHRGPDSPGAVDIARTVMTAQPRQWVQLVGNHEAQYLAPPRFHWPERLPPEVTETVFQAAIDQIVVPTQVVGERLQVMRVVPGVAFHPFR